MARTRRELLPDGARLGAAAVVGGASLGNGVAGAASGTSGSAPYALGFRSLEHEVRLPHLEVDGALPRWLRGVLVRNGPALFEIGEQQLNHWFDGLAMLHAFAFGDGRVSYANRFLRSSAVRRVEAHGQDEVLGVRDGPVPGDLQRRHDAARARAGARTPTCRSSASATASAR